MKNNIRLSLLLIFVFIGTILFGFVNKLTAPRILSNEELLINGFLLDVVEKITDSEIKNLIKNMIGIKE